MNKKLASSDDKGNDTKPWRRITYYISGLLAFLAAAVAFKNNLTSLTDWMWPKPTITLSQAKMTIKTPPPPNLDKYFLEVDFSASMQGGRTNQVVACTGKGVVDAKEVLSSALTDKSSVSIEAGNQNAMLKVVGAPALQSGFNAKFLNFRLECDEVGETPVTPVEVTFINAEPKPPGPARPAQTFKVCMGNGGGPNCISGADAVFNCASYRAMGGGAKQTYDELTKKFCSYSDNGATRIYPNKVDVTYDVGGGECGWTAFRVVCNP